jgi:hypothetical protein
MKHPRQHSEKHLAFIRGLPCVICGDNTSTEAAHVRYSDWRVGKRHTGMAEKPDDAFTVPLCNRHHREQHTTSETRFWKDLGIDPILVSLALWKASGDHELGEQIASVWRS